MQKQQNYWPQQRTITIQEEQLQKMLQSEQDKVVVNLPDANPIKKRQKLKPHSIFPIQPLPKFNYSSDHLQPTVINDTVSYVKEKLQLQLNQFKQIFKEPVYVYTDRASVKNNSQFGCIRALFSESGHKHDNNLAAFKCIKSVNQIKNNVFSELQNGTSQQITKSQNNKLYQIHQQPGSSNQMPNQDKQIEFQSRFESGNLCFASKSNTSCTQSTTYNLICSRDINTSKCTQWFFFKTINKKIGKVTFNILNFNKSYSIFQNGMKICYACKSSGYKWLRGCSDIKYRQTNIPISVKKEKYYYALSFTFNYQSIQDHVYFSYCYPYTYSMLQQFLFLRTQTSPYLKRRNIAITPGGNCVDLITISNFQQKQYKKRIVFVTSRVHPGETPSSFICEGMMKFLLGESEEAKSLRENFIFKFVPMLNPDGVINGSYRCSLSGYDLNRVWHRADKNSHPEIYATRKAIFETNQFQKIFMFADLHAHSKKKGVFAYGCQDKTNPYFCRQIPFLFWKNVPDFNYYQCNFMMRKGRQGTSRLFIYNQMQIDYSYTIEHSFCGPAKQKVHYVPKSYYKIGVDYLLTFYKFFCKNKKNIFSDQAQIFQELYANKQLIKVGEVQECSSSDQQLDKDKAPKIETSQKNQRKLQKKQTLKIDENVTKNKKRTTSSTFCKTNNNMLSLTKSKQFYYQTKLRQVPSFIKTMRPLPIVDTTFRQRKQQQSTPLITFRPKVYSSLMGTVKVDNIQKKYFTRETFRYDQQQDAGSLTNLFLPSLTRVSYKKYNRKSSSPKNMVQIGSSLIQNAIILKQEIKSISKRKQGWKDQARSYL